MEKARDMERMIGVAKAMGKMTGVAKAMGKAIGAAKAKAKDMGKAIGVAKATAKAPSSMGIATNVAIQAILRHAAQNLGKASKATAMDAGSEGTQLINAQKGKGRAAKVET